MSTYIIGDLQGCFDSLQALLKKIAYDPTIDRLGFVGDLVNRGPKSLETMRFLMQLKNPLIVLGNHDLHLMALYFLKNRHAFKNISHTLQSILSASDCDDIIQFLITKPFLIVESQFALVHAGIPPQWTLQTAMHYANKISAKMQENPILFFEKIYGNEPATWRDDLSEWDEIRYAVNALTRMRFCNQVGVLDLENKTASASHTIYRPWFEWIHPNIDIYFGHWAALRGQCSNPRTIALDTGCAWGETLTACCVETKTLFSVESVEKSA